MKAVKTMMIVTICLVLVLAVGLAGFLVLSLNGILPGLSLFSGNYNLELANRLTFSAAEFDELTVDYNSESITLLRSTGDEVVLEEYMNRWDDDMLASAQTGGKTLSITAGRRNAINIGLGGFRCQVKLYVPADWDAKVQLATSSGSVRSEDSFTFAVFSGQSKSGSVRMQDVTAKGGITLATSSGSVWCETVMAATIMEVMRQQDKSTMLKAVSLF